MGDLPEVTKWIHLRAQAPNCCIVSPPQSLGGWLSWITNVENSLQLLRLMDYHRRCTLSGPSTQTFFCVSRSGNTAVVKKLGKSLATSTSGPLLSPGT